MDHIYTIENAEFQHELEQGRREACAFERNKANSITPPGC